MGSTPPTSTTTATVVVVLLGPPDRTTVAPVDVPAGATVIGVDGGVDHAIALGLAVHVAVGDFDSVTPAGLACVEASGARIERHPEAKDETDFELGLAAAAGLHPDHILVVGGRGGRLDHALANLLVLAAPTWAPARVEAVLDGSRVTVVRDTVTLTGRPGGLVSLLAIGGPALAVTTTGLRYPLTSEDLVPTSARGISNVFVDRTATVALTGGVLLAVQPDPRPGSPR